MFMREAVFFCLGVYAGTTGSNHRFLWIKSQRNYPQKARGALFSRFKHLNFKILRRPPEGMFAALVRVLRLVRARPEMCK